jgi:hypothetical protein
MKDVSLLAFLLLFVLHHDLWFWDDATLILGLPVGLTYHVALCLVAAFVFRSLSNVFLPETDRGDS